MSFAVIGYLAEGVFVKCTAPTQSGKVSCLPCRHMNTNSVIIQ
jgi:hypothetical protein